MLRVACSCTGGRRLANVTVTLALIEYTSPVWSYIQECAGDGEAEAITGAEADGGAE